MIRIPSWLLVSAGLAMAGAACDPAEQEEAPGDVAGGGEVSRGGGVGPGCGPSTGYWREVPLTGPNRLTTIHLRDGSFLRIAAGVVPSGQTYVYRLGEEPNDNGRVVGTLTPQNAPINAPAGGGAPYVLRINHAPCGNREFSAIWWVEGNRYYGASASQRGQYVEAAMPRFGSTYVAAAPVLLGISADPTGADTVGLGGEMGILPR